MAKLIESEVKGIQLKEGQTVLDVEGNEYLIEKGDCLQEADEFTYMMLGRLKSDVEYYFGNGGQNERHLWGTTVKEHADEMERLYYSLKPSEYPEWLPLDEFKAMVKRLRNSK